MSTTRPNTKKRVFLSAAEVSGDSHCANLINCLREKGCDIEFVGVGGEQMAAAGCELLEDTVSRAAMIYNAFGHVWYYLKLLRRIKACLKENAVDLVVVCDSPAFNFHVAKSAKKAGIKTLFYVAPQLWAWAPWRIRKLRKYCDSLACILPFEQKWFSTRGIKAAFVGNPLLDNVTCDELTRRGRDYGDFDADQAKIALLPGSRKAEIDSLWIPMQRIALRLKQVYPNIKFKAVAANDHCQKLLQAKQISDFACEYATDGVSEAAEWADFAIVASGSVTLQVAAAGCPMVIMYQSSRLLWHLLGRWLVNSGYLSLINILADKELVPEFMPYFRSTDPIVDKCCELLDDRARLAQTSRELVKLVGPLAAKKAGRETAQIVMEMLD